MADGLDFCTPAFNNAGIQPCETNEGIFPMIMYDQFEYVPYTEGAGKYRGSLAVARDWRFIGDEGVLQLRTDRQKFPPYGLNGGQPGALSESFINPDTENRQIGKTTIRLKKGDVYRLITQGAGGWGNPLERDVKMVLDDVCDEKVSIKRAREVYGVVINEGNMEVDMDGTRKLRKAMKKGAPSTRITVNLSFTERKGGIL